MSVDVSSMLVVGLPYVEIKKFLEDKHSDAVDAFLNDLDCERDGLVYISPWYDADRDDWFVGYEIDNISEHISCLAFAGAAAGVATEIERLAGMFSNRFFGLVPTVRISQHVY